MVPFGNVVLLLTLLVIGILAAAALLSRRRQRRTQPAETLPLDRQLMRGAAVIHAVLFTVFWAVLGYEHLMPNPWGEPNVILLLIWLPIFIAHMIAQFWVEARAKFSTVDASREREIYREGYADGRRDVERNLRRDPLIRLSDEGELLEDYPDLGEIKPKRSLDE
jgi:amino acid permease